ncbi:MAG TPA: CBS domain-containing protein [Candidatus Dormibacteraeota bacterium]|jgi:CBS domain-containing protein|nr:CBS domain-containing protein [Candidatus Dormibacteraeota bacterium]
MRVGEVMTSPAITVGPDTSCKEAAGLLARHRISALPVVDDRHRLIGIVSEADLLPLETSPDPRALATPLAPRREPLPSRVDEVMTREVMSVDEDTDLGLAASRMLETGVKRLPVLRGDRVVGVISRHDLIKVMARRDEDLEAGIRRLLADEGMRLAGLGVRVRDGVVELSGQDPSTLRLAQILARTVPGVLDVRTRSEARPAGGTPPTGPPLAQGGDLRSNRGRGGDEPSTPVPERGASDTEATDERRTREGRAAGP